MACETDAEKVSSMRLTKSNLNTLIQKQNELIEHEQIMRRCLELVKLTKGKLEVEQLQLKSMLDGLSMDETVPVQRLSDKKNKPLPAQEEVDVNKQKLDLDASTALSRMVSGTYCISEEEEEEEEDMEDEDDNGDDGTAKVLLKSTEVAPRRKYIRRKYPKRAKYSCSEDITVFDFIKM